MPAPQSRRRIGVMGGTFDPIHNGHLVAASEVAAAFNLDEVLFVPTGDSWQKGATTDAEHRYAMVVIATESNPLFRASRIDVDRVGPTYTVDTLRELRAANPDADLFFITGTDAMARIDTWKDVDDLWQLAHFVVVTRPGHSLDLPAAPAGAISVVEIPALEISSTAIRERVRADRPLWYLLPDGVVAYIAKNELYQPEGGHK